MLAFEKQDGKNAGSLVVDHQTKERINVLQCNKRSDIGLRFSFAARLIAPTTRTVGAITVNAASGVLLDNRGADPDQDGIQSKRSVVQISETYRQLASSEMA